jgi:DNA ligase (NAD+)
MLKRLAQAGVSMAAAPALRGALQGKSFVLTGSLVAFTREEAKRMIEEQGGTVAPGVSKNVTYVIVGEDAGSKLAKAKKLGIPTLTEKEFLSMIR